MILIDDSDLLLVTSARLLFHIKPVDGAVVAL